MTEESQVFEIEFNVYGGTGKSSYESGHANVSFVDPETGLKVFIGANTGFGLIVLKNSVFDEICEFFARTARPTFRGRGFGQIGLLPLIWRLTASYAKSHLTYRYHGFFPKNYGI